MNSIIETLTNLTIQYIIAQILTVLMYATLVVTYYMKDRNKILYLNVLGLALVGIAYILQSAYTGMAMCIIAIIRNYIFLYDEKKNGKNENITKKDWLILIGVYISIIVVTAFSYDGFLSLLSVFATSLYTLSVWQKKTIVYKILGVPTGLLWISYNIYIGSLFGIILDATLLVATVIGFGIEYKQKKLNM